MALDVHRFSGEDPTFLLDFLTRLVEEWDNLEVTESQRLPVLKKFLTGTD